MNTKTRLILIVALLGISTVVLAVAFVQCGGAPAPTTTVQPATDRAATEDTVTLSGETAAPVTPLDGATVEPGTPTSAPVPTPTLTKEEVLAQTLAQSGGQFTSSVDECSEILTTEDWCGVINWTLAIFSEGVG
jgi:hypothetical protein